jgi:glucose/arabinose dehydrogenase
LDRHSKVHIERRRRHSYPGVGAHTGLVQAGGYYVDANTGDFITGTAGHIISILQPGGTPDSPLIPVGALQLTFPDGWEHNQLGIAARPTPGQPGSYDLVFNVGSEFDHELSTDKVQLSGLASATLDGDSLYSVTLNLSAAKPVASDVRKIATGIRNVIGMGFQPGTGDFYFADNAIDGTGPDGDEPPQAEEINVIAAARLGAGAPLDFGYPGCYTEYRTGNLIGDGCVRPFFAIQPLPNGTLLGSESEGVAQLAFAPADFPPGFNNGIFLGFSGQGNRHRCRE